jgi:hypothetical protein
LILWFGREGLSRLPTISFQAKPLFGGRYMKDVENDNHNGLIVVEGDFDELLKSIGVQAKDEESGSEGKPPAPETKPTALTGSWTEGNVEYIIVGPSGFAVKQKGGDPENEPPQYPEPPADKKKKKVPPEMPPEGDGGQWSMGMGEFLELIDNEAYRKWVSKWMTKNPGKTLKDASQEWKSHQHSELEQKAETQDKKIEELEKKVTDLESGEPNKPDPKSSEGGSEDFSNNDFGKGAAALLAHVKGMKVGE